MTAGLRKFVLTVHVTVSVGWLGAVVAYLAPAIAVLTTEQPATARAAWLAMELIGWYAIVPLAAASVLSGLINALATPWGLFRHYWVLAKLLLTLFAATVLLLHMPDVSLLAGLAAELDDDALGALGSDLLHAAGGLAVLLLTAILAIYKPRGLTRYGWRKQQERRADTPPGG